MIRTSLHFNFLPWGWVASLLLMPPVPSTLAADLPPPLAARAAAPGQVVVADAQLQAAGWPAAFDRAHVALTRQGKTLPLTDTGDGFAFVAPQAGTSWLSLADAPAPRQTLPARLPTPLTWSPAALYDRHAQTASGRSWWAGELRGDAPLSATVMLDTALPAGTPVQIQLRATAAGSHAVAVVLDGQPQPTLRWSDATPQVVTHTLTLGAHAAGPLRLDLAQAVAGDTVRVAAITLPTVFPLAPALPAPTLRHVVPWPADAAQADLLILAHADFLPALDPLIAAHAQRGERAVAVDVQAAYDAYGFGDPTPEAIRMLIRTLQPRAVLLVGAGSVATGAAAAARPMFIPPYLVVLPFDGETACDSCYGRLAVGDVRAQVVPDVPVGRLPVRTRAEAEAVVAKTASALTAAPAGSWQTRALVVADNDLAADGTPDPAGPFSATVAAALAALPRGVAATTLAYAPNEAQASGMWEPDVARLRCRMFRALDGGRASDTACAPNTADARGVALWVYVGHGSPWQWGATEPTAATPYLWYLYDADARRNRAQLPILLGMTCLSGDFANPVLETTDERLVLRASGGALASLSSTGEGVNTGHQALLPAVVGQLYAPSGDRSLGTALLAGLRALGVAHADQAYTFGILGDPLVGVPWVPQGTAYLPLVTR